MQAALYDPGHGYYQRDHIIFGEKGDFTTTPVLGPALGQAIARWVVAELHDRPPPWDLIETGAGDGSLANAILRNLGFWHRRKVRYHIVEISPRLQARQRRTLGGRRICWHAEMESALAATDHPIVLSNEFVDAFPCRILQRKSQQWYELHVAHDLQGTVREIWRPWKGSPVQFSALQTDWAVESQRIELHESYAQWFAEHFDKRKRCRLLTIDYGDRFPALYHRRPSGTMRAYFRNMRLQAEEVYARPGLQDLTADVNFTDLQNWARDTGFETQLSTLRDWVGQWFPATLTKQPRLFAEEGAGGAFQVLTGWR